MYGKSGVLDGDGRKYLDAAEHLFNRAVEDAWDADGAPGIVYTTDWEGKPVVHDRMHWTLAEGVNTAATLFHVTGKQEYADWYATFLEYIDTYLMDRVNGSWFHQLDRTNKPIDTVWPVKTPLDSYECRHGIGYTTFHTNYQGIESTLTAFVPLYTAAEINHLSVRNNTGEAVTVDVTGCVEWCLWNAVDDASNFQRNLSTGEVEVEQTGTNTIVYHKTEFKERRNHYAFFSVNEPTVGFDTSRDEFLGQFNGWDSPQVIAEGRMCDSVAHGWYPIAAERVRLTLQPGEERMLVFMLGYIEVPDDQKWEDPNDPAKVGIITNSRRTSCSRGSTRARRCSRHSMSSARRGMSCSAASRSPRETASSTAWSTSGTSTSAWSHSTFRAPPRTTSPAWAAAWASVIRTRTCSALCT